MKAIFHIPTQSFGFLEIHGTEKDFDKMEKLYNKYAETPVDFDSRDTLGGFVEYDTYTGEKVLYNEEKHEYLSLDGKKLISGSAFAEAKEKPFNKAVILTKVSEKHGIPEADIDAMWNGNGSLSRTFGTAVHLAMENWFRGRKHGTEYHIPKHPFLKLLVESYPKKDAEILPELLISNVAKRMVGRIDGLEVVDMEKKVGNILDFKSDYNVKKNLKRHTLQLSFYARILELAGWKIEKLIIENYTDKWESYELEKVDLNK